MHISIDEIWELIRYSINRVEIEENEVKKGFIFTFLLLFKIDNKFFKNIKENSKIFIPYTELPKIIFNKLVILRFNSDSVDFLFKNKYERNIFASVENYHFVNEDFLTIQEIVKNILNLV
jgi:hypothetical protein